MSDAPTRAGEDRGRGPGHLATAAVAFVPAVLVVAAAAAFAEWPVPAFAERWVGERLQRTVHLDGEATFRLAPRPTLHADAVEIGPPDWSRASRFARAGDVELTLSPGALLRGRVHVESLRIGHGDVLLERLEDGRASWQLPAGDAPRGSRAPQIERLEARDVDWRLVDAARGLDLTGTLTLVDGAARPEGDGTAGPPPRLAVRAQGTLRGLPLQASVDGGGVLPGAGRRPLVVRARAGEGRLSLDAEVDELASLAGLRGRFDVRGPALAALGGLFGAVLPNTPPFRLAGTVRHDEDRWTLDVEGATVGDSDLSGRVVFVASQGDTPARLDGRLASRRMRLADLGRSVGFGSERAGRRDRVLPDVSLDLPTLRDMDAQLALRIERLELGAVAPVTGLGATLRLERGVLAIGELQAAVAGGTLSGELRIDATARPGRVHAALRMRRLALQQWLPPVRGRPPIEARLNAEIEVGGRGDSVADVLASADGHARAALGPGTASRLMLEVAGLDLAESLLALSGGDRAIALDCGLVDLRIRDGVARPEAMIVDTRDTVLTADGRVDLGRERLALRVRAAPRDFSPLTVRSPIDVGGTFADPAVSVDRSRIAGRLIASAVLGAVVAPLAALVPLLDFGEGDPPSGCATRYRGADAPATNGASR